jgi:predicted helicase
VTFDKTYILNLHGNSKKKETCPDGSKDENVFDIQQGVSINLFIKTGRKNNSALADIFYFDIFGMRKMKYMFLFENTIDSISWKKVDPTPLYFFFVPKDFSSNEEYEKGVKIQNIFLSSGVGICTKRDSFTIKHTEKEMKKTILIFLSLSDEEARSIFNLGNDSDE